MHSVRRTTLVLLTATALATGALAGATLAQAAPMKPEGFALVSVSGGTATTKEIGKHRYRITTPLESDVYWIGKVKGKGDRTGTFTREELVKGWTKLGYRPDRGAPATLAWRDTATSVVGTRSALITNPRVNKDGDLVFTAKLVDPSGNTLPATMPNFNISLQDPTETTTRKYNIYWPVKSLSSTFGYQVSAGADTSASAQFKTTDASGNWTNCTATKSDGTSATYWPGSGKSKQSFKYPDAWTCGGSAIVSSDDNYVDWDPMTDLKQWAALTVCFKVQIPQGATSVKRCSTKYTWGPNGNYPDPLPLS